MNLELPFSRIHITKSCLRMTWVRFLSHDLSHENDYHKEKTDRHNSLAQ